MWKSLLHLFDGSESKNKVDEMTGLTKSEINHIRSSWGRIHNNLKNVGVQLLLTYLKNYPSEIEYFSFKNIPIAELEDSKVFHVHCLNIMYILSSIVDNIDNPELLPDILCKIGNNHHKRLVSPESFWKLKEVMVNEFGSLMSETEKRAWDKALNVCFKAFEVQLKMP